MVAKRCATRTERAGNARERKEADTVVRDRCPSWHQVLIWPADLL
jgi:hypothetical protein